MVVKGVFQFVLTATDSEAEQVISSRRGKCGDSVFGKLPIFYAADILSYVTVLLKYLTKTHKMKILTLHLWHVWELLMVYLCSAQLLRSYYTTIVIITASIVFLNTDIFVVGLPSVGCSYCLFSVQIKERRAKTLLEVWISNIFGKDDPICMLWLFNKSFDSKVIVHL